MTSFKALFFALCLVAVSLCSAVAQETAHLRGRALAASQTNDNVKTTGQRLRRALPPASFGFFSGGWGGWGRKTQEVSPAADGVHRVLPPASFGFFSGGWGGWGRKTQEVSQNVDEPQHRVLPPASFGFFSGGWGGWGRKTQEVSQNANEIHHRVLPPASFGFFSGGWGGWGRKTMEVKAEEHQENVKPVDKLVDGLEVKTDGQHRALPPASFGFFSGGWGWGRKALEVSEPAPASEQGDKSILP